MKSLQLRSKIWLEIDSKPFLGDGRYRILSAINCRGLIRRTSLSMNVSSGETVRITAGAVIPDNADTVIPIEDVMEKNNQIFLKERPEPGQNVRYAGEEYSNEEILVDCGTVLKSGGLVEVLLFERT